VDFKFLIWLLSGDKQPSYKHFPAVGAFSLKFSIARPVAKLLIGSKKVRGCKNGMNLLTMPSMVGIVGRALAVDEKV